MSTACGRPQGEGSPAHVDAWVKNLICCGHHKWMAPITIDLCARAQLRGNIADDLFSLSPEMPSIFVHSQTCRCYNKSTTAQCTLKFLMTFSSFPRNLSFFTSVFDPHTYKVTFTIDNSPFTTENYILQL